MASGSRRIYLAADNYRWTCLLDPVWNGDWSPATYYGTCRLIRPNGDTAAVSFPRGVNVRDGVHYWTSYLDPQF